MLEYKRVLLKISGEALMGNKSFGYDYKVIEEIILDIQQVINLGVKLCIVVGGGNIFRGTGKLLLGIDRINADYVGMLATVMNALVLQDIMQNLGINSKIVSDMPIMNICEIYLRAKVKEYIENGEVVIFTAGIGKPLFTTDSAAVIKAIEVNCDLLLKGTKVDGVYDSDPLINSNARKFDNITYTEILEHNLKVMDKTALILASENNLPIKIFSIKKKGNITKVLQGNGCYTKVQ